MLKALVALMLLAPAAEDPTFTLSGKVAFNGAPPPVKADKRIADDKVCDALHKEAPPREELLVDAAGGVRWAFVYVKKGLEGKTFKAPAEAPLLDQAGCRYAPHVMGLQVGQPLDIRSSDPVIHNVHGLPFTNKEFNFSQAKGAVNRIVFNQTEVMVKVKCDVHSWMSAWIGVLDHPFFAVTDAAGRYEIKGLPAGKYTVAVWQEGCLPTEQELEVSKAATLDFKIDKR
jgi:hypothetical protein